MYISIMYSEGKMLSSKSLMMCIYDYTLYYTIHETVMVRVVWLVCVMLMGTGIIVLSVGTRKLQMHSYSGQVGRWAGE